MEKHILQYHGIQLTCPCQIVKAFSNFRKKKAIQHYLCLRTRDGQLYTTLNSTGCVFTAFWKSFRNTIQPFQDAHTTLPLQHLPISTAADYKCCIDIIDVDYRCIFTCECSFPYWLVGRSLWQGTPAGHQYLSPTEKHNPWQLVTWQCHVYPCRSRRQMHTV